MQSPWPNLKLISQTGKISGHIDVAAASARGIAIAEGVGGPSAPAELTWALIMAARRKIVPYASYLKAGRWQISALAPQHNQLGMLLQGQTLGIWGYGKIGRRIAAYGKAFGMIVQIWGRADSRLAAVRDGFLAAESKAAFFLHSTSSSCIYA